MVNFIAFFQTPEDRDGISYRRLIDKNRLKTPFQGRVFFHMQAIFIQSGGPDAMKLAAGQHRFQQITSIHGAFGFSGTHHRMHLINKENNFSVGILHFFEDCFQPFFKFTPKLGPGNQSPHIQGNQFFLFQTFRYVLADNTLSQTFDNGSFTNPRFTNQNRIILSPPGKDLDHPPNFFIPADNRIKLSLACRPSQIKTVFLQSLIGVLRIL